MSHSKSLSRRQFLRLAALGGAGVALAACGGAPATSAPGATTAAEQTAQSNATVSGGVPASSGAVTVDVWIQQGSVDTAAEATKAFEKKNPDIKMNMIPTPLGETATKLLAAIAAGSGTPDLAYIEYPNMIEFTSRGGNGLTDLSDLLAPTKDQFVKWSLDLATAEGKIYGHPTDLGVAALFYRRDAFEAAGLPSDPDGVQKRLATWDDYIATGKQISKDSKHAMLANASEVFDVLRQQGKQRYFDDQGNPVVNSKAFVDAAQFARRVRESKLDAQQSAWGPEWTAAMQQGTVATYGAAAWFDAVIHGSAPATGGKWGVVPLPGNSTATFGGSYFVIPQLSKKREAAFKYISYVLASQDGLNAHMQKTKFLPGWRPFYTSAIFTTPDSFYNNQVWLKIFVDLVDKVPEIRTNVNDPIASDVLGQALTRILDQGADPQTELNQANEEIKKRIKAG